MEEYIEPFDPIEEFREGEERESPLIRQVRFNPSIPETYRATNDEPIITPESIEEKITDIEEVVVSGAKNTQGFFERAVEWIGEQLGGRNATVKEPTKAELRAEKFSEKPRPSMPFTRAGKEVVKELNKEKNDGKTICETCGTETVPGKKSEKELLLLEMKRK